MQKKIFFCGVAVFIIAFGAIALFSFGDNSLTEGVREFGPLKIGEGIPVGPGDFTFAPYKSIPRSTFYVTIVQDDQWCILDDCGLEGALVHTMGGWLQMERPINFPDIEEMVGLDLEKKRKIRSIVIVGNHEGKIVGIYPTKGLRDVLPILRFHPDSADFNRLKGVTAYGSLKVGDLAPLKPEDPTGYRLDERSSDPYFRTHIPAGKKFYVYIFNQHLLGLGYCAFALCETRFEYQSGSTIEDLGGWFSSDGTNETARAFWLDPEKIARGEESLVVVTDSSGIIVSIHPKKNLGDILSIMSQHPNLADVTQLYRRPWWIR